MTRWSVMVNPRAGSGRHAPARARDALTNAGVSFVLHVPSDRAELRTRLAELIAAGERHFVAVGGDGTVNALVNDLLQHDWEEPPVLGVLPSGTGCDLIRTFGISQRMDEAATHLARPGEYLIDVGVVEGSWGLRYFVNVGETGVAAEAARVAEQLPARLGKARYPLGLIKALPGFRATEVLVEAGARRYEGSALAVVFANGQFFGGGFNIAPRATLIDGDLDVQIITCRKSRAAQLVPRIYRGAHLADRDVHRFVSDTVRVSTPEPWPVEVDGEYLGNTPVTASVLRSRIALKI